MKLRKTTIVLIIGLFIFLTCLYITIGYADKEANKAYRIAKKAGKPLIEYKQTGAYFGYIETKEIGIDTTENGSSIIYSTSFEIKK